MKKRIFALLLILTFGTGLLTACGGSSDAAASAPAMEAPAAGAPMEKFDSENGFSGSTTSSLADFSAIRENAKLILRAEMEAEAKDFENSENSIQELTAQAGGYIESSSIGGSVGYRWANYTLRVPQEKFEAFLEQIGDTCHVTYTSTESTDVTENYYDTEARLTTQKTKQERLLALLEKAEVMEDIIALETALADVNYEIESLTGTLRHYDSLVGFSIITLHLNEVRDLTAVQEEASFGSELKLAFISGTRGFVEFVQKLLLFAANCWPFLIGLALLVTLLVVIQRRRPHKEKVRIRTNILKTNKDEKPEEPKE